MGDLVGAHAVGVSSGTDALIMGLMALSVGEGDRVLTSPFSFFATAGAIRRLGAIPVFSDISLDGFGLDPTAIDSAAASDLKALVPVHLFGDVCDLPGLRSRVSGVPILEDAAQALGVVGADGSHAGTQSDIGAFSFFPTKNLGACGDAGMVVTKDENRLSVLKRLRSHGQSTQYRHEVVGGNFRLDAIQAAALDAALPFLEADTEARRLNASRYRTLIAERDLTEDQVIVPREAKGHTYHQFVIRIPNGKRDSVQAALQSRGIGCAVYYPIPFHLQPCFRDLGHKKGAFPNAELACEEVLALPIYPGLREHEQVEVADSLLQILKLG
jgi:dTDP-4-amino-4,6-dideoxygalactose transaminase